MKKNYVVLHKKGNKFSIKENQTDQILETFDDRSSAQLLCKKYNNGMGFGGWTPSFIANIFSEKEEKRVK